MWKCKQKKSFPPQVIFGHRVHHSNRNPKAVSKIAQRAKALPITPEAWDWSLRGTRRERPPKGCPLTSTRIPYCTCMGSMCVLMDTQRHTPNKCGGFFFHFFKLQSSYLNLFNPRSLETKIKTIMNQRANFGMISIIAHTNDRDFSMLYQAYEFLKGKLGT